MVSNKISFSRFRSFSIKSTMRLLTLSVFFSLILMVLLHEIDEEAQIDAPACSKRSGKPKGSLLSKLYPSMTTEPNNSDDNDTKQEPKLKEGYEEANKNSIPEENEINRRIYESYNFPNPLLNSNEDLLATLKLGNDYNSRRSSNRDNLTVIPLPTRESTESPVNSVGKSLLAATNDCDTKINNINPRRSMSGAEFIQDGNVASLREAQAYQASVPILGGQPFYDGRQKSVNIGNGAMQSQLKISGVDQICYACSTVNNPRCWTPDEYTTIKLCQRGKNGCITKSFGEGKSYTLIRDCGNSCEESNIGGITPKLKSCSVCHSDLCNAAYSINPYNIISSILLFGVVKYMC